MAETHITLLNPEEHKKQDGCIRRHEPAFDNPAFPKCAYRPKGYAEITSGTATRLVPPVSKRSLYELDFKRLHPDGTPIQNNHRKRLPNTMESFTQTGRQKKEEKEKGLPRKKYQNTDPRGDEKAWHLEGDNYKEWHLPFAHEYHHIMPVEALEAALDPTTSEDQILVRSGYNINNGKNIIILPITRDVAYALMLPKHKGWHRKYNQECAAFISDIKQAISETTPEHGITEGNVGGVRKQIETWQERMFAELVTEGRTAAMTRGAAAEINKMVKK
jgi:hypothetical protein